MRRPPHPRAPIPPDNLDPRLDASVESDIVGYSTVDKQSTWTLLGINFVSLDKTSQEAKTYSIQQITGDFADGDMIQAWDGAKYTTVYYFSEETMGKAGFYNSDATLSTLQIPCGAAIWVNSSAMTHAMVAGKVMTDSVSVEGTAGWALFAASQPVDTPVNNLQFTGLLDGDMMQIWNGSAYKTLYYFTEESMGEAGFYESDATLSQEVIARGTGFWVKSQNGVTLKK